MTYNKLIHWCTSLLSKNHGNRHKKLNEWTDPYDDPSRPDWLVLFMSAIFLLTVLIAWLVDIPAMLR